ncbi:hypothetical protein V5799_000769 [Amblyomma americanum]|uniref:Uncharacterized protein n=1 Tax=Amblyomma americanum TaxID=6943 RepID=A0AAQ4D239_AMBAM
MTEAQGSRRHLRAARGDDDQEATTTTTRKTTTTTRKPTTTSTTTRRTTTTCAPTTVRVIGCEQALPPSTTSSTTTTKTTTTSTTPKPYLHGHPYVVIKLHEVPGTRRVPVELINLGPPLQPLSPLRKHHPSNGTETERNASHHVSEHRSWFRGSSSSEAGDGQHRKVGEKHASRSRRIPEYEAETAALKREVAGNLMRVLRTIRELDSVAKGPQQEEEETEEKLEQAEGQDAMQPAQLEEQDPVRLVVPNPALDIDRLLRGRGNARGLKSAKRWTTQYPDELRENPAEEGDLHQFSILLKKALDELNAPPTTRTTTRPTTTKKKKLQTTTRPRKEFLGRR